MFQQNHRMRQAELMLFSGVPLGWRISLRNLPWLAISTHVCLVVCWLRLAATRIEITEADTRTLLKLGSFSWGETCRICPSLDQQKYLHHLPLLSSAFGLSPKAYSSPL